VSLTTAILFHQLFEGISLVIPILASLPHKEVECHVASVEDKETSGGWHHRCTSSQRVMAHNPSFRTLNFILILRYLRNMATPMIRDRFSYHWKEEVKRYSLFENERFIDFSRLCRICLLFWGVRVSYGRMGAIQVCIVFFKYHFTVC
jgi:hypothetical protein